jgi:hypothetical protein
MTPGCSTRYGPPTPLTSSTGFPPGLDTQLGRPFDGVELIAAGGRCADLCTIQATAYAVSDR